MPFLPGGAKGASTRNSRPRCSAGVVQAATLVVVHPRRTSSAQPWRRIAARSAGIPRSRRAAPASVRRWPGSGRKAPAGLLLERGRASVVKQDRVERGRVQGRGTAAKHGDVGRAGIVRERNPRRQRDGRAKVHAPGPASSRRRHRRARRESRADRRARLIDDPLHIGKGEGAGFLAVAGFAGRPLPPNVSCSKSFLPLSSSPSSA